ncbi:MAG: hypothetical protein ACOZCO_13235 [Bacteroidota bacterium]
MENSNCFPGSRYPQWPFPWPFPFPFPFPDPFPPYLNSVTSSFGSIHNELLDGYAVAFPALNGTHPEIWNFMMTGTTRLTAQEGITGGKFISFKAANDHAVNIKASLNNYLRELVKDGEMTPFIAEQTNIMLGIIKDTADGTDISFRLTAYANRIALKTDVSAEDKMILMGGAQVGIYSGNFWDYALKTASSPYHQIAVDLNAGGNLFKIKWADLIGFVVGAVAGSGGGPVGSVTTGIALGGFASEVFGEK